VEDCLLCEGPHAGAGEKSGEEGGAATTCDELIATPIPCPSAPLGGEGGRQFRSKVEPGTKRGVGGKCCGFFFLRFGFISHYRTLF